MPRTRLAVAVDGVAAVGDGAGAVVVAVYGTVAVAVDVAGTEAAVVAADGSVAVAVVAGTEPRLSPTDARPAEPG